MRFLRNVEGLPSKLKLRESWKLSKLPYVEVAFRSVQTSRGGGSEIETKRFASSMRSAKISKTAFSIFASAGSAFPFLEYAVYQSPQALVSSISLSLAISLAYIVFYSLQVLPFLTGATPYSLLSTLPIDERDFSLVALFSFVRTFDYLAASSALVQIALVWLLTQSVTATALMLVATIVNTIFSAAIALWLSGMFYRNITRGVRSTKGTIARIVFLLGWGFAVLSIAFIFSFISFILPYINSTIAGGIAQPGGLLISVLHPFPLSLVIANSVFPNLFSPAIVQGGPSTTIPEFVQPLVVYGMAAGYLLLAFIVGRRTFNSVTMIALGRGFHGIQARLSPRDLDLRIRSMLPAFVLKDLRLASKNASLAFLYASPLFEVVTLAVVTAQFPILRTSAMIVSTMVGCFFTVMICSTLLNTEGAGLDYTLSLPIRGSIVVYSKALVAVLTYVPVPLALLAIGLTRQLTSVYSLFIPLVELLAVVAASMAEIAFYMNLQGSRRRGEPKDIHRADNGERGQSRGLSLLASSDVLRLIASFVLAFAILLVPVGSYIATYLGTTNHLSALVAMLLTSIAELGMVQRHVRGKRTVPS